VFSLRVIHESRGCASRLCTVNQAKDFFEAHPEEAKELEQAIFNELRGIAPEDAEGFDSDTDLDDVSGDDDDDAMEKQMFQDAAAEAASSAQ